MKAMVPGLPGPGSGLFNIVAVLTGAVIAGEALALLIGMVLLSPPLNSWITLRNIFLLGLDIVCGAGLIGLVLLWRGNFRVALMFTLVVIAFSSHAYREWEYFTHMAMNRFLINKPLFVLNNVKLIGISGLAGIILTSIFR